MIKEKSIKYLLTVLLIISISVNLFAWQKIQNFNKEIWDEKETVPVSQKEEIKKEEVWKKYTGELGFSMKIPQAVHDVYRCSSDETIWVPVKVFEDEENEIVFITQEYYYEAKYNSELNKYMEPCEKITYSLELLKREIEPIPKFTISPKPWLGLAIAVKNINNDIELNEFVKDTYGSGCLVEKKESWKQDGVYEIEIKGEDWDKGADLGTTTCPVNYIYKILYAPEKNKIMSVNLGQECTFGTDFIPESYSEYKCYDEEMLDSFEFE